MCDCGCFPTTFETEGTVALGGGFDLSLTDPFAGSVSDSSAVIPAGQPGGPELWGTGLWDTELVGTGEVVAGTTFVDPSATSFLPADPGVTDSTAVSDMLLADASIIGGGTTELSTPMALAGLMDLPGVDATDKATLASIINSNALMNERTLAPSHDIFGNSL